MEKIRCRKSLIMLRSALLILSLLILHNCKTYSLDSIPYVITGEFVMDESASDYSLCGVDFFIMNKTEKEIRSFNVVLFLFDQDGEPAYECSSKISADIEKSISSGESTSFCMSLDKFMNTIPSDPLIVDYLYLSKIEYQDGSVWEDPYGMAAFK